MLRIFNMLKAAAVKKLWRDKQLFWYRIKDKAERSVRGGRFCGFETREVIDLMFE
jgi:hypothetical protein